MDLEISKSNFSQNKINRNHFFDFITGIFIVQIIIMHCFSFWGSYSWFELLNTISTIYLPWFFFKSGYYYKDQNISTTITSLSKKLLIPYLVWLLIGLCVYILINGNSFSAIQNLIEKDLATIFLCGFSQANGPIWFLLSLFTSSLLSHIILKAKYNSLLWILLLIIGYYLSSTNIVLILGLNNIFICSSFYILGVKSRIIKINKLKIKSIVIFILIFIYTFIFIISHSFVHLRKNELLYGSYFSFVILNSIGLITLLLFSEIFPNISLYPINFIGRHSMIYFCAHWPLIFIVEHSLRLMHLDLHAYRLLSIIFIFLLCTVLIKPIEKIAYITRAIKKNKHNPL